MQLQLRHRTVDLTDGAVTGDVPTHLSPRELCLLRYLVERADTDVDRQELLCQAFGYHPAAASRAVDKTMSSLRSKLEPARSSPVFLLTVDGGYRFRPGSTTPGGGEVNGFVGRLAELRQLRTCLGSPGVYTIVGAPGVGKSRLARRAAAQQGHDVLRCSLDAGRSVLDAVGHAMGLGVPTASTVGRALACKGPVVVVLDGIERDHSHAADLVQSWHACAPEVAFLVTSRHPLVIADERLLRLGPLSASDGVALLRMRAGDRGVDLELDDTLPPLVEALDGLPLALELAAYRLELLSPQQLLLRLPRDPGVLYSRRRDVAERHLSLEATLDFALDALDEAQRAAMRSLARFDGPFTLEDAEAQLPRGPASLGPAAMLQDLFDHSLLERSGRGPVRRLRLLHVVRRHLGLWGPRAEVRDLSPPLRVVGGGGWAATRPPEGLPS